MPNFDQADIELLLSLAFVDSMSRTEWVRAHYRLSEQWRRVVQPSGALGVVFDGPEESTKATRLAARFLLLAAWRPQFGDWARRSFRNAFVHGSVASDPISASGDAIHFFRAERVKPDWERVARRILGELAEPQRAEKDAGNALAAELSEVTSAFHLIVCDWLSPREEAWSHFLDQAKDWVETQVASHDVPIAAEVLDDWDDAKNDRRCELIEKKFAEGLTPDEGAALDDLQEEMYRHRRLVTPLPITKFQQLEESLKTKSSRPQ